MQVQQQTIHTAIHFEGIGLHTGKKIKVTLLPMPTDSGIQFQRIDLADCPIVEALVTNIAGTDRSTTLQKGGAQIATVEHLLSALVGLEIDNISIQLDGPEVPDLDGSAKAFVDLLLHAGIALQEKKRSFFQLKTFFRYDDPETDSYFEYYPQDTYSLACTIAYKKFPLENQYAILQTLGDFKEEIAPARTFIYIDEIIESYNKGLLRGVDPQNVLIFSKDDAYVDLLEEIKILSGKQLSPLVSPGINLASRLRYNNESARHKLLDLMGDLMLLGRPLQGKIFAHKPGHGPNIRFVTALHKILRTQARKDIPHVNLNAPPLLDVNQISKMLPHRYPFQLVDKIMHIDEKSIIGIKNVTINEPFFQGHFPDIPIMPGVLQLEALAQTSGILALYKVENPSHYLTYFLAIDGCKFRRIVVPGDTLTLHCELLSDIKFNVSKQRSVAMTKVKGRVFVGAALASEAILLAQIVKNHDPYNV